MTQFTAPPDDRVNSNRLKRFKHFLRGASDKRVEYGHVSVCDCPR